VSELLRANARLLTLTGPGGSGKTRLAIEAATALVTEFKAGVFWVDLAPLRDPRLVAASISDVLGAKDGLAEHIGQREMLLVLDNLEQVIEASAELATLVETCPSLRLLVTSRERLRVRGEVELPVAPLADPDAIALFCARAQLPPDEAVHQLCLALDNLPLALELAAARASVLTPSEILERLSRRLDLFRGGRDADPRQQTLRTTIEWSHELLSAEDQQLFARLAVFVGGWTLQAAEEVVHADLDGLESLVDKSLVRHAGDRFWMLETIREYAVERLEASAEAGEVRRRHADFFLALAESRESLVRAEELGGGGREWLDRQARELDNSRTALDLLETAEDPQLAIRMAGALAAIWASPLLANKAHVAEGRRRLARALALDQSPTAARGKALLAAADIAHFSEDPVAARTSAQEALDLYRQLGDRSGTAEAVVMLGVELGEGGNWVAARPLIEESLELYRGLGDEVQVMWHTRTLAWAYAELGDLERARPLYEDALRQARVAGNRLFESVVLGSLAWLALEQQRVHDAPALMKESLRIQGAIGDPVQLAIGFAHAAQILTALGRPEPAVQLLSSFEIQSEELGGAFPWVVRMNETTLRQIRAQIDPAVFTAAWQEGANLTSERALSLALGALDVVS
jgi:predicted ATPase